MVDLGERQFLAQLVALAAVAGEVDRDSKYFVFFSILRTFVMKVVELATTTNGKRL